MEVYHNINHYISQNYPNFLALYEMFSLLGNNSSSSFEGSLCEKMQVEDNFHEIEIIKSTACHYIF